MAEISVVIPAYNAAKTLGSCLKSLFNQTFKDIEVIIVNDGSTDDTTKILEKFKDKIKIINQKNQGAATARNRGAKEAYAPFIIFCDADVVMKPKMLEIMYQTLKNHRGVSYVYSSFKFGWKTFKLLPFSAPKLQQMPYVHTTSLIRYEHFPSFDPSLKKFQDWDLWLTMLEQDHIGHFIPQVLFTVKPGGSMSKWLPKFVYDIPWPWKFKRLEVYRQAERIIKEKHKLW